MTAGAPTPAVASLPVDSATGDAPLLSIVIPAYNEAKRLPLTLPRIQAWIAQFGQGAEVVISDDGSSDGTPDLVRRDYPWCRVLDGHGNHGKGAAVRRGMLAARGQYRLFSDADLSTPIEEAAGMLDRMRADGWDVVIASRALPGSRLVVRQPWWRELSGRTFNALVRPLAGLPFRDTQCGFKLFTAAAAERLFTAQQSPGWAFDVELLMLARHFGLRVLEHPVAWLNDDASKVHLASAAPRMFRDIIRFRLRLLRGIR